MKKYFCLSLLAICHSFFGIAQLKWTNVDSLYQPLPSSVHVYFTNQPIDTAPFRAYYFIADPKDKKIDFTADTTLNRRLTPAKFYEKNEKPLVVVNCTFFSFETNRSLNVVIKNGSLVAFNQHLIPGKGKDTLKYFHPLRSAIGISKKRKADVAWLFTDSSAKFPYATRSEPYLIENDRSDFYLKDIRVHPFACGFFYLRPKPYFKWKMQTSVGGGPVLLQRGEMNISNEEERMFVGKAINDKHPRSAMGYTKDGKLIILMIEGRNSLAHGATLGQEAQILKDLSCWEALNLDGGGSSCMLVNGKETIKPSDAAGQRPVPAVFIIRNH